ncbi:MAG: 16S rRNA (adenine(1518)-N(6)/adenine(1519)-N(6))-dimethyltransferase RsmA [Betaproteobacteria bacterium]
MPATHTPRKRFSQNFLQDRGIVQRIIAAIGPQRDERIVEIGPGPGALTAPLLDRLARLDVIEIDRDIVRDLRARFPPKNLHVHQGDALDFDFSVFGADIRVVGNLPYSISTPLLFHLTAQAALLRDCHFMLQREVVERMAADPGSPEYGRLSVMLQYRWGIESLFDVPPTAFHPQPEVWSSVVRMTPHAILPHRASDESLFADVVTRAFGQRRKTLRNALRELLEARELEQLGIEAGARGETLGVPQFVRIANYLEERRR